MTAGSSESSERVLSFWLGELRSDDELPADKTRSWFEKSEAFDALIRSTFGREMELAPSGALDAWAASPRGRLALVILLDQMRRNAFRGKPESFAGDAHALALTLDGIVRGHDLEVRPLERVFFYLPLEHAEDMQAQDRSVELFETLSRVSPPALRALAASYLDFARRHRAIIQRFARFPHRNAILGRASMLEELAFLREPGSSF